MKTKKRSLYFLLVMTAICGFLLSLRLDSAEIAYAQSSDCVIPPSGPWPFCATAGTTPPSNLGDDCVIPSSGPWPLCARDSTSSSTNSGNNCVISPSGPWPSCATSGATPPSNLGDDCVIPPSGPWPSCAKNNTSSQSSTTSETQPSNVLASDQQGKNYIRLVGDWSETTDNLQLEWHVEGVNQVSILRIDYSLQGPESIPQKYTYSPASGSRQQLFPDTYGGFEVAYNVYANPSTTQYHGGSEPILSIFVKPPCAYEKLVPTDSQCPTKAVTSPAIQQNFEGGFMIYTEHTGTVRWGTWSGGIHSNYHRGSAPEWTYPTTPPPAGRSLPDTRFADMWQYRYLGWAVGEPQAFTYGEQGSLTQQQLQYNRYCCSRVFTMAGGGYVRYSTSTPNWTVSSPQMPSLPEVVSFSADKAQANPGDTITLNWTTRHVWQDEILLIVPDSSASGSTTHLVSPNGSFNYTIPEGLKNRINFQLDIYAYPESYDERSAFTSVKLSCQYNWFFTPPYHLCPEENPSTTQGVYQPFENGAMVYIASEERIYTMRIQNENACFRQMIGNNFSDTASPHLVRDSFSFDQPGPTLSPPSGRYAPESGFGQVWHRHQEIQDDLGWATGPIIRYEMTTQPIDLGEWIHFSLPDNRIAGVDNDEWGYGCRFLRDASVTP